MPVVNPKAFILALEAATASVSEDLEAICRSIGVTQDLPVKRVHHKNSNKIICEELYQQGYISFEIYRADEVIADIKIRDQLKTFEDSGYGELPICVAKRKISKYS